MIISIGTAIWLGVGAAFISVGVGYLLRYTWAAVLLYGYPDIGFEGTYYYTRGVIENSSLNINLFNIAKAIASVVIVYGLYYIILV